MKTSFKGETPKNISLIDQEFDVRIERLGGLGEGEARIEDRKVFVACTMANDRVKVRVTYENKEFLRASVVKLVEPATERASPFCSWFMQCGGCTLQQLPVQEYRQFKQTMMTEAVRKAGYNPAICEPCFFLPNDSRRRVEFKVQQVDGTNRLGLLKLNSHTLVDVDHCPILTPKLQTILKPLKAWVLEYPLAQQIKAIRIAEIDDALDMVIEWRVPFSITDTEQQALMKRWNVSRLTLVDTKNNSRAVGAITKKMGGLDVAIPPDVFLQASIDGEGWLIEQVIKGCGKARTIADLFCGIGTYSFPLSQTHNVSAFELDGKMIRTIRAVENKHIRATKRDLFMEPLTGKELKPFDAVVINPPREGAKAQSVELAKAGVRTIVMVSCNPATFTRDAKIFREAGYTLERAVGLDQFVFSPYLEMVAVFRK